MKNTFFKASGRNLDVCYLCTNGNAGIFPTSTFPQGL
jgi:hypothetical protein